MKNRNQTKKDTTFIMHQCGKNEVMHEIFLLRSFKLIFYRVQHRYIIKIRYLKQGHDMQQTKSKTDN